MSGGRAKEESAEKSGRSARFRKVRKWVSRVLFAVLALVIILILPGIGFWLGELPFRLFAGWYFFLGGKLGEVSFDREKLAVALLASGAALAGLHWLARGWRRRCWPEARPWRWRWTFAIGAFLLAAALSALAVAGASHQIGWLSREPQMVSYGHPGRERILNLSNARTLAIALRAYSSEQPEGAEAPFPESLHDLVPHWIDVDAGPRRSPFYYRSGDSALPEPWLYFGADLPRDAPANDMLVASPREHRGRRIVGFAGGHATALPEEDFQERLAEQRSRARRPEGR